MTVAEKRESPTAVCAVDREPLVFTFLWPKQEFVCIRCGRLYDFFGPQSADTTPELDARAEANKEKFAEITKGWIASGAMYLNDCEVCKNLHEPHMNHADPTELDAHIAAKERWAQFIADQRSWK